MTFIVSHFSPAALLIALLVSSCGEDDIANSGPVEGEYLFVEMFILSSARELEGDCTIGVVNGRHTFYTYNPVNRSLDYRTGEPFPLNNDLKLVFGFTHVFEPLTGAYDVDVRIIPVYYFADQVTEHTRINGVDSVNMSVEITAGFASRSHHTIRVPFTIYLPPDSTYSQVFKTIEGGVTEPSTGDSCIWEYTDSLLITNYGLNPKSKINWEPIAGPI